MVAPVLTFLGAAGTVTGSRYLVRTPDRTLLVDCGLFQGLKALRLRNWKPFPVAPASIDDVVLTHAHLDHSGYLPALVRDGFRGPVYGTTATAALCGVLLPDSAHLEEAAAERANRKGYSKHRPALPLYTEADARRALERLRPVAFREEVGLGGPTFEMRRAGHILGAAWIRLKVEGRTVLFSGDLGRPDDPVLHPPEAPESADYVVVESTYGDRLHPKEPPARILGEVVRSTAERGGVIVIPAFAVGRAQSLLHLLAELRGSGAIPSLPVFLDSPMAGDVTRFLLAHPGEHRLTPEQSGAIRDMVTITRTVEESKAIDGRNGPMVVVSASGMATGGRVLFHLARFAPDPRNTILFAGHQAVGTRGAAMLDGAAKVKIHGHWVPIRARVVALDGLSAHADADEILAWLSEMPESPRAAFVTHGEPTASDALRHRIQEELGWEVRVPEHGESVALEGSGG